VAEANNRHVGRPIAHPADKIEYARPLKAQGSAPLATSCQKQSLSRRTKALWPETASALSAAGHSQNCGCRNRQFVLFIQRITARSIRRR